jgi:parallel beta-helix repeat protein
MVGQKCHNLRLEHNTVEYNNFERFSINNCGEHCRVAGIRIARADNLLIRNNLFRMNYGHGLWFDLGCKNANITRNAALNNLGHGIYYKSSSKAIVGSNILSKNEKCGFKIFGSAHVRIYNNVFNRNAINLGVYDNCRSSTINTTNTEIINNLFSNTDGCGPFFDSNVRHVNSRQMISAMSNNGWYRTTSKMPTRMFYWCPGTSSKSCVNYTTHAAFRQATKLDTVPPSIVVENNGTNPFFINEGAGDFNLLPNCSARNSGMTLPADIALAIGVKASPVNMGALIWRGQSTSPQVLRISVTDDATIQENLPNNRSGIEEQLFADNDPRTDFLIKFTVSGVGSRTVVNATLQLYALNAGKAGAKVYQVAHNSWNQVNKKQSAIFIFILDGSYVEYGPLDCAA